MGKLVIKGLKECQKAFKMLPDRVSRKVVRQAMRAGLQPMKARAQELTPVKTGDLKRLIKVRVRKGKRRGQIAIDVQINKGSNAFYGAFEDLGHDQVHGGRKDSGGVVTGHYPGSHFLDRAFDQTAQGCKATIERGIRAGLEREVAQLGQELKGQ